MADTENQPAGTGRHAARRYPLVRPSKQGSRQNRRDVWKALAVVVPGVLTAASLVWGVITFSDQQQQANKTEFFKKQLEVTMDASDTVAVLATTDNMDEWRKARQKFFELFWGNLSAVENHAIESKMADIARKLADPPPLPLPYAALQHDSRQLAICVRELALRSWGVQLEGLPERSRPSGSVANSTC